MQIIVTATIKGGTGKTTTAAALAQCAAHEGKKVLCIDLDAQADLSFMLGADQNRAGAYDLLHGEAPAGLVQRTVQGLDVIPGAPDLATETTKAKSAYRLAQAVEPLKKKYDYIIIDTPPQLGELTFNALQCATGLLIPLETDNCSLQGLYQITDLARVSRASNKGLKNIGCIITRYDARSKINRFLHDAIADKAAELNAPLLMAVRPGVAIREAQALQKNLFDYAPRSKPAQDYAELFSAISGRKWGNP